MSEGSPSAVGIVIPTARRPFHLLKSTSHSQQNAPFRSTPTPEEKRGRGGHYAGVKGALIYLTSLSFAFFDLLCVVCCV